MYAAQAQGKKFHIFCDETRPRSQGATLTAWELAPAKSFPPGHRRQRRWTFDAGGEIDLVIVGSDRTLGAHRRSANKIAPTPRRFWRNGMGFRFT